MFSSRYAITFILLTAVFMMVAVPQETNSSELAISWKDNSSNEDGFDIERGSSTNGPYESVATLGPNSTSYVDSSVASNVNYCYRVTAFNSFGSSSSAAVCATSSSDANNETPTGSVFISDNFEQYGTGKDPSNWRDTKKDNSFDEDPNLFKTTNVGNTTTLGTDSGDTNIHSHFTGPEALSWTNYVYTGRMYISHQGGGIGVTFFSRFPEKRDVYYRLRRYAQKPKFHIASHGTTVKGDIDSDVSPVPGSWYKFHIEVMDTGAQTTIHAKVWKEGEQEPEDFQINAFDDSQTRIKSGTIGVWSMGQGSKNFDDLTVLDPDSKDSGPAINNPPVAQFNMNPDGSAVAGQSILFDARNSFDPDNDNITYKWDFGDGTLGEGDTLYHSYSDPGLYEVNLTVSDMDLSDSTSSEVKVDLPSNSVPVAVITTNPSTSVLLGETLFFDASQSFDPDGDPLTYTWDFGDGSPTASGVETSHKFSVPGMYEVMLIIDDGQLSASKIEIIEVDEHPDTMLLSETFEEYGSNKDPLDWRDTKRNNSMAEDQNLFKTIQWADIMAFGTSSKDTNIHSHFIGDQALSWNNYTYTGRMYIDQATGGIGVTFLSRFPDNKNVYYRIRRYANVRRFHLAPHGTTVEGDLYSDVIPKTMTWYLFRIEVEDTGTQTNIRAKIWEVGSDEPEEFQIDAYDRSRSRITTGTVGVWTMGEGLKLFDNLQVKPRL